MPANGQTPSYMAIWGTVSALRKQLIKTPRFAVALDYLAKAVEPGSEEYERITQVPEGETRRVELGEGVFALEQSYVGKPVAQGRWEAHDQHIDLQAIVVGPERMDVCPRAQLTVEEDRLETNDVCFLHDSGAHSEWVVQSGEVAVFFQCDAHRPSLVAGEPKLIHKTCVKVVG